MSWFSWLKQRCAATWLTLRLSLHLGIFLIWYGVNRYVLGRVFLVSMGLFFLSLLLTAHQVMNARLTNTITPDLSTLALSPTLYTQLSWKLVSLPELKTICDTITAAHVTQPSHQSLAQNHTFCLLTQNQVLTAQEVWKQAQSRNPNH